MGTKHCIYPYADPHFKKWERDVGPTWRPPHHSHRFINMRVISRDCIPVPGRCNERKPPKLRVGNFRPNESTLDSIDY
jgi:hypothetical protein